MSVLQKVVINDVTDVTGNLAVTVAALTAGSTVAVFVQCQLNAGFFVLAATATGCTFTSRQTGDDAANTQVALIAAENVSAGATTVNVSITFPIARFVSGFIVEYGGVPASAVDAAPTIATATSTTATPTSTGTLAQAAEDAAVCIFGDGSATFGTPSGGPTWTDSGSGQLNDGDGRRVQLWTATTAATTALAPSSTLSGSEPWLAAILTVKQSSAGAAFVPQSPVNPMVQSILAR